MALSLQEISDRLEIQDLIAEYSHAVDRRDFDAFDRLFTADAVIDYTAAGGIRGNLVEIKEFLRSTLGSIFEAFQHLAATSKITIDGDSATARTYCYNPMFFKDAVAPPMIVGIWYVDRFVRTADGWRFAERSEEKSYMMSLPGATLA